MNYHNMIISKIYNKIKDYVYMYNSYKPMYIGNDTVLVKLKIDNKRMYVDLKDVCISEHLISNGVWESHVTKNYISHIEDVDTIVDIGSNMGYYPIVANDYNHKIYAYEPNPRTFSYLERNYWLNAMYNNVVINNIALSNIVNDVDMYIHETNSGASSLHSEWAPQINTQRCIVKCDTIDNQCINHVDLIRLDVEGNEYNTIDGGFNTISRDMPIIFFEHLTQRNFKSPIPLLESFGYKFKSILGNGKLVDGIDTSTYDYIAYSKS